MPIYEGTPYIWRSQERAAALVQCVVATGCIARTPRVALIEATEIEVFNDIRSGAHRNRYGKSTVMCQARAHYVIKRRHSTFLLACFTFGTVECPVVENQGLHRRCRRGCVELFLPRLLKTAGEFGIRCTFRDERVYFCVDPLERGV